MSIPSPDPYNVLQLPHDASPEEIKRAYRRLLLIYHPDKQHDIKEGDERLIALNLAYRTLTDSERRAAYERGDGTIAGRKEGKESTAEKRARNPTRTISLEEFTFHASSSTADSASNEDANGYYTHPCRCSGSYRITIAELEEGVDIVGCEGCGEWVGVGYEVVEDGDDGSEDEQSDA